MRSEYFSSQPSRIRGHKEKEISDPINWDRIVYLTMVAIAALVLLYFIFDYFMVIEGNGQVMADRYDVRFPVDVRITGMYVQEGDSVQTGDRLFSFVRTYQTQSPQQRRDEKRRLKEKIVDIEGDIAEERTALNNSEDRMGYLKEQKELLKREIRLGVSNVRDLRNIEREILNTGEDIALASSKLKKLKDQEEILQQWYNSDELVGNIAEPGVDIGTEVSSGEELNGPFQPIDFTTPSPGIIERIDKDVTELTVRSESIVTIKRETKDLFIRAIFLRDNINYITNGDTLGIKFDHGINSKGVVTGFEIPQFSNWDIIEEEKFNNINKYVVVRLEPVDSEAFEVWNKNSNVGVTIRKTVF